MDLVSLIRTALPDFTPLPAASLTPASTDEPLALTTQPMALTTQPTADSFQGALQATQNSSAAAPVQASAAPVVQDSELLATEKVLTDALALARTLTTLVEEVDTPTDASLAAQLSTLATSGLDPSTLFDGQASGSTATLLGGGWGGPLPPTDPSAQAQMATYYFSQNDIPAISSSSAKGAIQDGSRQLPESGAAMEAYRHQRGPHSPMEEGVGADFKPKAARVDLED